MGSRTSFVITAIALAACAPRPERAACAPNALVAIEAAYLADVLIACDEDESFDLCEARPEIEARYRAQREEWIACR